MAFVGRYQEAMVLNKKSGLFDCRVFRVKKSTTSFLCLRCFFYFVPW